MQLEPSYIRKDCKKKCEQVGFNFHTIDHQPYWDESHCYRFTEKEIDQLDDATVELHQMAIIATEAIIHAGDYEKYHIPIQWGSIIENSWNKNEPSLYGRMDLCFNDGKIKLLEYNADTPTSLLEASIVQWDWLVDTHPNADQFNSIHEKLIAQWKQMPSGIYPIHFACQSESLEDINTTEYLVRTCEEAGLNTEWVFIEDIGHLNDRFVDNNNQPIYNLFKLYPSEWLLDEEFAQYIIKSDVRFIEPSWKVITSSKAILVKMWEMFPNHPNLLATYFKPNNLNNYVRKPIFSREGANIEINLYGGKLIASDGDYNAPYVYQEYSPLPKFNDDYALVGSWVIGGQSAGIGIREDSTLITCNTSRFIPHYF